MERSGDSGRAAASPSRRACLRIRSLKQNPVLQRQLCRATLPLKNSCVKVRPALGASLLQTWPLRRISLSSCETWAFILAMAGL